jgi:hypothetical protein
MAYIKLDENLTCTDHARLAEDLRTLAALTVLTTQRIVPPSSLLKQYGDNFLNATLGDTGARSHRYDIVTIEALHQATYAYAFNNVRLSWFWFALAASTSGVITSPLYDDRDRAEKALMWLIFSGVRKYRLDKFLDKEMIFQTVAYYPKKHSFESESLSPLAIMIMHKRPALCNRIRISAALLGFKHVNRLIYTYALKKNHISMDIRKYHPTLI